MLTLDACSATDDTSRLFSTENGIHKGLQPPTESHNTSRTFGSLRIKLDRTYQSEHARSTLSVERSGVRPSRERAAAARSSTQVQQSTADPAVSRTPPVAGHPARQVGSDEAMLGAVSQSVARRARDQSSKPEMVVAGSKRGSATYGATFKGELTVSFSARVPRLLFETAFVGRHDARIAACCSLADLFDTADVERGAATIVCTGRLWSADSSFHFASFFGRHKNAYNAASSATILSHCIAEFG